MPPAKAPTTAELMLEILEQLSLGAATAGKVARQLRRSHPLTGASRRVPGLIELLAEEGLVEEVDRRDGDARFRATESGLAALRSNGRFSGADAVLFTDIVDSTELIGRFGEEGAHARRQRHFSLLRDAVAGAGGHEVKNLGDGLMVVFAGARAAIECAAAMQRSVAGDADGLGLRVGVHAGELLREGDDYFGGTVVVASRLCNVAEAGEAVVSDDALAAAGEVAIESEPLGALDLKGIGESVLASRLLWEGPKGERPSPTSPIRRKRQSDRTDR